MKPYKVLLAVEIEGRIYGHGSVVELDLETAARYAHALIAVEKGEENGGNNEGPHSN